MRKALALAAILFAVGATSTALDLRGYTRIALAQNEVNALSTYNPFNLHQLKSVEMYMRGSLTFKTPFKFGLISQGTLKLDGYLKPMVFEPDFYKNNSVLRESLFIKALFLDIISPTLSLSFGKQYLKWGQSSLFSTIDVFNPRKDILTPPDEIEGNPYIQIKYIISDQMALEILSRLSSEEKVLDLNILKLPLIVKYSYSDKNFNIFFFTLLQQKDYVQSDASLPPKTEFNPFFGTSVAYSFSINKETSNTIYSELSMKFKSDRKKVGLRVDKPDYPTDFEIVPMDDPYFLGFVLGSKLSLSMPTSKLLGGLDFNLEFFFDAENWSDREFQNYLSWLDSLASFGDIEDHHDALSFREPFRASRTYGYAKIGARSLFVNDLNPSLDFVLNFTDMSFVAMPSVTYPFKDENLMFGIRFPIWWGREKKVDSLAIADLLSAKLPDVTKRSEFGTDTANFAVMIYLDVSL